EDREWDREHGSICAGSGAGGGCGGSSRRGVGRGSRIGARVSARRGTDGRTIRAGWSQRRGGPPVVPEWRSGAPESGWGVGVRGAQRSAGEGARLPDRVGRGGRGVAGTRGGE